LIQKSSDAASDSLMSDTTGARPRVFRDAVLWNERRSSAAKADGAISFLRDGLPAKRNDAGAQAQNASEGEECRRLTN
jgi:hypothetical protein